MAATFGAMLGADGALAALHLSDLFLAGLGFDLGGALLVARGLIADPAELNRIAGTFYGSNPYQAVGRARDRIDAATGLSALALGFLLQGVGYLALLSGARSQSAGAGEVAAGVVILILAFLLVLLAGMARRRWRLTPLLIEMSRRGLDGSRLPYPAASQLPGRLRAAGHNQADGEDDLSFVRRVVGVEDMVVHVAAPPGTSGTRSRLASEPPLEGER